MSYTHPVPSFKFDLFFLICRQSYEKEYSNSMLDFFTNYMKPQSNENTDEQNEPRSNSKSDWLKDPSFFFNQNRKCHPIKNKLKNQEKTPNNNNSKAVNKSEYLPPKVNFQPGHKDIPQSTIEKISPAYRIIKEAFNELQLFTKVCESIMVFLIQVIFYLQYLNFLIWDI